MFSPKILCSCALDKSSSAEGYFQRCHRSTHRLSLRDLGMHGMRVCSISPQNGLKGFRS